MNVDKYLVGRCAGMGEDAENFIKSDCCFYRYENDDEWNICHLFYLKNSKWVFSKSSFCRPIVCYNILNNKACTKYDKVPAKKINEILYAYLYISSSLWGVEKVWTGGINSEAF